MLWNSSGLADDVIVCVINPQCFAGLWLAGGILLYYNDHKNSILFNEKSNEASFRNVT